MTAKSSHRSSNSHNHALERSVANGCLIALIAIALVCGVIAVNFLFWWALIVTAWRYWFGG